MKPDLYTKSVLTVIAGSLLWLAIQNSRSLAVVSAQGSPNAQRVILVDGNDHPLVNNAGPVSKAVPVHVLDSN
jgi:hypothetical protein